MEKETKHRSIREIIKSWRLGDYFRQFSIVTAGIVVTFVGSGMITKCSDQNEMVSMMRLIKEELVYNRERIVICRQKIELDIRGARMLINNNFNSRQIEADTLIKYLTLINLRSSFDGVSDALEVFKGSSLMNKMTDKKMLMDLIRVYADMNTLRIDVGDYYSIKKDVADDVALSIDHKLRDNTNIANLYGTYDYFLADKRFLNFCLMSRNFFDKERFSGNIESIDSMIAIISQKFDLE